MRATMTQMAVMDGYFAARPARPSLYLTAWGLAHWRRLMIQKLPALQPALMGSLRMGMGAGVGAGFGAASGHFGVWIAAGLALGAALNAVMGQIAPARPADPGRPAGEATRIQ
jgi:hypothetical protein